MRDAAPSRRIDGVQLLRALAALMVVCGHAQTSAANMAALEGSAFARLTGVPWGAGVDLFFLISGFIMVHASEHLFGTPDGWRRFIGLRLARVAPLYWIATTLYLAILWWAAARGGEAAPSVATVAASYLFIPYGAGAPGGMAFPIYSLGWTLNYEMFFYLLFAAVLWLRRGKALTVLTCVLAGLVVAGAVLRPSESALRFWTQPILLDFGIGVLIGWAYRRGVAWPRAWRVAAVLIGASLFALDILGVFSGQPGATTANGAPRVLSAGVPAALLLAGCVLGPDPVAGRFTPAVLIGNASYSLYLFHPFVLIVMEKLVLKTGVSAVVGYWLIVWASVLSAVAVSIAVYVFIERPATRFAQSLGRVRPLRAPAGAIPIQHPEVS